MQRTGAAGILSGVLESGSGAAPAADRPYVIPQMRLRNRVIFTTAFTLFAAFCWSVGPYWTAALHSGETPKGDLAHRQVAQDTRQHFAGRALLGSAVGLVISLATIMPRDRTPAG